jgi:hypothetical protein
MGLVKVSTGDNGEGYRNVPPQCFVRQRAGNLSNSFL